MSDSGPLHTRINKKPAQERTSCFQSAGLTFILVDKPNRTRLAWKFNPLFCFSPQLIQFKADTSAANEHGNTPLHYACFWGQDQVAEVGAPPCGYQSLLAVSVTQSHSDLLFASRILSLMGLRSASVTNMAKLPWTKPNLTCVNSFEVYWLKWNYSVIKSSLMNSFNANSSSQFTQITDKAEKMGQNLTKIPFKDSFWKGTTRTRPRKFVSIISPQKNIHFLIHQTLYFEFIWISTISSVKFLC